MSTEERYASRVGATPSEKYISDSGFIAAAHELKAPLALIRQLAFQLEDDTVSAAEKKLFASKVRLSAEKALRVTTDLTKAARLEDAMFTLEPVNATAICKEVLYELQEYAASRGKKLQVQAGRSLPPVIANHDLLRRIVTTFSDNALAYGGDTILLDVKRGRDGVVRIAVRDYGPALSLSDYYRIKKQLSRPQAVHARPQSSGLGLYIAHQFAHLMSGNIGIIRHRDGVSFYVDMNASTQLSLL